jgi:hypothetical protein
MKIVIRQIWIVILDAVSVVFGRSEENSDD